MSKSKQENYQLRKSMEEHRKAIQIQQRKLDEQNQKSNWNGVSDQRSNWNGNWNGTSPDLAKQIIHYDDQRLISVKSCNI